MIRDPFAKKLGNMIIDRCQESEKRFEEEIESIADIVGDSIYNEEYRVQDFLDALENCRDYSKTCDAAYNLCRYIFSNENCKKLGNNVLVKTIKCTWNYNYKKFCREIKDIFIREKLNVDKGFVYIFWTAAKLKYLYVGKANPEKDPINRLKCFQHTSVALSIQNDKATRLTVIYPNKRYIEDVEASIIRIIGKLKHNDPNHKESFTEGNSDLSQKLLRLKKFFSQLYSKFPHSQGINTKSGKS